MTKRNFLFKQKKLNVVVFVLAIIFASCNSTEQTGKDNLSIPDKVVVKKEGKHQQFPGTRVFMINPEGYSVVPSLVRFQKDRNTFIQAVELPTTSFEKQISSIKNEYEKLQRVKPFYQKQFILGDKNAFLVYNSNYSSTIDEMVLTFGDSEGSILIAGYFPSKNEKARQDVLSSMLTCYCDKSIKPDNSGFAKFTLDISNSDFKFNSNKSTITYYTIGGKGDPVSNSFENQIMVMTLPSMKGFDARKKYAQSMIQRYKSNGIEIPKFEEQEIKINNAIAYEINFNATYHGKPLKIYQVVVGDNNATVIFCGMAYDRQAELFNQFKSIAQTLKIK